LLPQFRLNHFSSKNETALGKLWGLMLAFEEAQPQMFSQLVAAAPDWVEWLG
jgi:hypothetical protein